MKNRVFTSESVTEGHPDKLCDQISDGVLDAILSKDPMARVACECIATTGAVFITGEITTNTWVDIPEIARAIIRDIGYDGDAGCGFDGSTCAVLTAISEQSGDIAMGVDQAFEAKNASQDADDMTGAGDQGMMFGYACDETAELMPLSASLAHRLARRLSEIRKNGELPYLRPDGKAQVSIEFGEDGDPLRCSAVVVSTQHGEIDIEALRKDIYEKVIVPVIPAKYLDDETKIYVNPTGRFVIGGPVGDSGLTGRKIIVDTYGGYARHGGGAFSGKDPTKVDRSAAYMARHIAKNIVAAGLARRCEIQIAYAIGVANPVSVCIETFGTGVISDDEISCIVSKCFDLRPAAIIKYLDLRRPIYRQIAAYGHFGRDDLDLPWEKTDRADELKTLAGIK